MQAPCIQNHIAKSGSFSAQFIDLLRIRSSQRERRRLNKNNENTRNEHSIERLLYSLAKSVSDMAAIVNSL